MISAVGELEVEDGGVVEVFAPAGAPFFSATTAARCTLGCCQPSLGISVSGSAPIPRRWCDRIAATHLPVPPKEI
ncbi:hypothetical protein SDJN03_13664, partial [Cucurbita argyrosperma subsp. sororia]